MKKMVTKCRKGKLAVGFLTMALMAILLTGCGSAAKELYVYNATEYIDEELLAAFEEAYDCTVVYETFDSNEEMYISIAGGAYYDVVIPSDYMIEKMIDRGLLAEIDWSLIPNADGLMEEVKNQSYDPDMTYAVPYFWGTVGILYDTTVVDSADLAAGWEILKNTKYAGDIFMYDSERDSFMVALKALGYSMNTNDNDEIMEAYAWLLEQYETMDPDYVGDEVIDAMMDGEKALAVVYSGDAAYVMSENEDMEYLTPAQGTNIWYDSMVILESSTQKDLAHAFINFMLEEENAYANTEEIGYTSPIQSVFDAMVAGEYADISAYVPDVSSGADEVFHSQEPKALSRCVAMWFKLKLVRGVAF